VQEAHWFSDRSCPWLFSRAKSQSHKEILHDYGAINNQNWKSAVEIAVKTIEYIGTTVGPWQVTIIIVINGRSETTPQ
jgi:hypothetical protein